MRPTFGTVLLGCMVAACSPTDKTLAPATPTTNEPSPSNASERVATLFMYRSQDAHFVGGSVRVHVDARDARGRSVGSAGATVTSSDPSVVRVTAVSEMSIVDAEGERRNDAFIDIRFDEPGSAVLRATLNGRESRVAFQVQALSRVTTSATLERFEVIEHQASCAWACPYLVYTPVVEIRTAAANAAPVTIVGLEVTISGATTGLCSGTFSTVPGIARHLVGFDPYLWNNDVQFVRLDGTQAPEGPATVRIIVREGADSYGTLTGSTTIRRRMSNPLLPPPSPPTEYWNC